MLFESTPALEEFSWCDLCSRLDATQGVTPDPVLRALPACPHLRTLSVVTRCASADAMRNLLQMQPSAALCLVLEMDHWFAVTDRIRRGHCKVKTLVLIMRQATRSEATKAAEAVASAIQLDSNLKNLHLDIEDGFTDEAGVALAEALTVNEPLINFALSVNSGIPRAHAAMLGTPAYEAFGAMLRVNKSLKNLVLPPFHSDDDDQRLVESYEQMKIEERLNQVGRGRLLASRQTTREEYVHALVELTFYNVHDPRNFEVSCLYSLLRLHPAVCMS